MKRTVPARARGVSATEYMIAVLLVGLSSVILYKTLSASYKCRIIMATRLFSEETAAECESEILPPLASNGPSPSGSGSAGPPAGVTCVGTVCTPGSNRCFAAGTLVSTPDGQRPIEQLQVGDQVLSRDERTGEVLPQRILATFVTPDMPLVAVTVGAADARSDTILATPGHMFWTATRGWLRADQLTSDDALLDASGGALAVAGLESLDRRETVYNFEVERTHTYFVGALATWVHNPPWGKKKPPPVAPWPPTAPPAAPLEPGEVPPFIHAIWPDEAIPPGQFHHLMDWADKAEKDGNVYTVKFWTTEHGVDELKKAQAPGYPPGVSEYDVLTAHHVEVHGDVRDQIPPRMRPYFDEALRTKSWAMASDIARYGYLRQQGGIHIDVDINPKNVNLKLPPPTVPDKNVPIIAPQLRDKDHWQKSAGAVNGNPDPSVTSDNGPILAHLYGVKNGKVPPPTSQENPPKINTIFVMAAPHATFFDDVDDKILDHFNNDHHHVVNAPGRPAPDPPRPPPPSRATRIKNWVTRTAPEPPPPPPARPSSPEPPEFRDFPKMVPGPDQKVDYSGKPVFNKKDGTPVMELIPLVKDDKTVMKSTYSTEEAGSVTGPGPFKEVLIDRGTPLSSYQLTDPNFLNMQFITPQSDQTDRGPNNAPAPPSNGEGSSSPAPVVTTPEPPPGPC